MNFKKLKSFVYNSYSRSKESKNFQRTRNESTPAKTVFRGCEPRNVQKRISLDEVSIVSEDRLNRDPLAPERGRPALRSTRPWARTTRAEVTSPMGEDDPRRGDLAHGRGRPAPRSLHPWARTDLLHFLRDKNFDTKMRGVEICPSRFAHIDTTDALGITEDIESLFEKIGLGNIFDLHCDYYADLTRQFLASARLYHPDEDNPVADKAMFSFIVNRQFHSMTIFQLCDVFGFGKGRQSCVPDFPEHNDFWKFIASGNFISREAKQARIRCEPRNVEKRISLDEVSIISEDRFNQDHLAVGGRRPAPRLPRPWARTPRAEVTSPMGKDDPHRGHFGHGRGSTSCPETVHPRLSSPNKIVGPLDAIPMSRLA
ncbi:hypothetical protein HID58_080881 [Brassica napus]|uniref:Arabidopsis retrotransposon Orf1 C-terminal domain-containing protein n=1 Tax=Brassica napus TaxID=3708 RepID=A0ABQ7Y9B0_BRANA|nr:hypothetical protein HID58_080881 [Brassica napus]